MTVRLHLFLLRRFGPVVLISVELGQNERLQQGIHGLWRVM